MFSKNIISFSFLVKNYKSESDGVFHRPFLTVYIPSVEDGAEGGEFGPWASLPLHLLPSLLDPDSKGREMQEWRVERRERRVRL